MGRAIDGQAKLRLGCATFAIAAGVPGVRQEIHEPQSTREQDASEDENCDVRVLWENLLPSESAEQARERCSFILVILKDDIMSIFNPHLHRQLLCDKSSNPNARSTFDVYYTHDLMFLFGKTMSVLLCEF